MGIKYAPTYPQTPTFQTAVGPGTYSTAITGDTVDMTTTSGECFAVQTIGVFEESHTWTGRIEQSANGSTSWTTVVAFTGVTEGQQSEVVNFTRTQRYVRYASSVVGADPECNLCVIVAAR